jgi:hypothetical protein
MFHVMYFLLDILHLLGSLGSLFLECSSPLFPLEVLLRLLLLHFFLFFCSLTPATHGPLRHKIITQSLHCLLLLVLHGLQVLSHETISIIRDHVLDLILNPLFEIVHGRHQSFPRILISGIAGLSSRCHIAEDSIPPRFFIWGPKQLLVSCNFKLLGFSFDRHLIELFLPHLLVVLCDVVEKVDASFIIEHWLSVVVMLLSDLLFLHFPDFELQLSLFLDVVVLDWRFIAPVKNFAHGGFHISRSILHTEYNCGFWLQRL